MKCPICATDMDVHTRHGVKIDHCPGCGGVWLDPGELDHLLAAVRPAVTLPDPDPVPARPVPPPPHPEPTRGKQYTPKKTLKPVRFEDRDRKKPKKSSRSHRYGRRYSKGVRLKDVLEEIFDFD